MKKYPALILALLLLISVSVTSFAAEPAQPLRCGVLEIEKYGNLVLDIAAETLSAAGYAYGDLVRITIDGKEYTAPLCLNYTDVVSGEYVLRCSEEGRVLLAINAGDFASTIGIAQKQQAANGNTTWTISGGRTLSALELTITMQQKEGYLSQFLAHRLLRTNEREDYASDQVFANFRNIPLGDLGENALFRSSSPVNNELGRAAYADRFAERWQIKTVLNLADSETELQQHLAAGDFNSPYYRSLCESGSVKALGLGMDFTADDFRSPLAEGLRFLAGREGPYLIHCTEGKDRAGFVSALLSCFMGATCDEVVADYMTTYENYYHITPEDTQYETVKSSNLATILSAITGTQDTAAYSRIDLAAAAKTYLLGCGLTEEECAALRAALSTDYPSPTLGSYTVRTGDCLWHIAEALYGSGQRWTAIYHENRDIIRDPDLIFAGQVLRLPA